MFNAIDRTKLSQEQRQLLEVYEAGFKSSFWRFVAERFENLAEAEQNIYDTVQGDQALGVIQGRRSISRAVAQLDAVVAREFEAMIADQAAEEPEAAGFDDIWSD